MVISTKFLKEKNDLDLESLPMNEAHTDSLELLSLVENEQYNKMVLSLENALSYCENNAIGLDQLIGAVSQHYFIDEKISHQFFINLFIYLQFYTHHHILY